MILEKQTESREEALMAASFILEHIEVYLLQSDAIKFPFAGWFIGRQPGGDDDDDDAAQTSAGL